MPARKSGGQYGQYEYAYVIDGGEYAADLEVLGFPVQEYWRQIAEIGDIARAILAERQQQ